jgi:hypothetical protein
MSKEAMKLALEALNNSVDLVVEDAYNAEKLYGNYPTRQGKVGGLKVLAENHKEAIKALEEALAKQEQGVPVAWRDRKSGTLLHEEWLDADPLYTTPQQRTWVGLTDDDLPLPLYEYSSDFQVAMQWTEAKLKEKNT